MPANALVIGGGFIGLEMAENLNGNGIHVTLVEKASHVLPNLDQEMAEIVHKKIRSMGIDLILNAGITGVNESGAILEDGGVVNAEVILCCIGVHPNNQLAVDAGFTLGVKGCIKVNAEMETSAKDIYAVGDVVESINIVTGQPDSIPLAGPANKQGRIVADVLCGRNVSYHGSQGTSILKLNDMTIASTGASEHLLKMQNIPYLKSYTHSWPHAGYYPGGTQMSVKLLFSPDGARIHGAQIVGYEGVDKRIDVFAVAIRMGASVQDLTEFELAYAPPFSSAKDPVNMAGYVASNIIAGYMVPFYCEDLAQLDPQKDILIDIRTEREFSKGTIPGAINIPLDSIRERYQDIPRDKNIYLSSISTKFAKIINFLK